jgi:tetratricopeptide (TPR) repeat protein
MKTFAKKHLVYPLYLAVGLVFTVLVSACSVSIPLLPPPSLPSPSPLPTTQEIRTALEEGAAAREQGDYSTGEQKLGWAFESAVALQDKALAIETGNNVSIQYRLSAGRASRANQGAETEAYSEKSLQIYEKLRQNGWFDEQDPQLVRNWAHALLYAGEIEEAAAALQTSLELQTTPAAQGDESNHLAAAYLAQGKQDQARQLFTKGITLVEDNNGSKIWLTFGLMTKATWEAQTNQPEAAKKTLEKALKIAQENKLTIRQEEIEYMINMPVEDMNVLKVVGRGT